MFGYLHIVHIRSAACVYFFVKLTLKLKKKKFKNHKIVTFLHPTRLK